jgi:phage protein D
MSRLPIEQFEGFGDDLAPNFDILISHPLDLTSQAAAGVSSGDVRGSELFEQLRPLVAGVSFEDDEEMSSLFEMTVINQPDTGPAQPVDWRAVIDSKAFAEGNHVDLYMGYGSSRVFMDRSEIIKWLPRFGVEGPTEFVIKGFDGRHKMTLGNQFRVSGGKKKKQRKSFYRNMTDDAIVRKIAEKYGYAVNFDVPEVKKKAVKTTKKNAKGESVTVKQHVFPTRVQGSEVTDWEFLQRLATINRFDLWVDFDPAKGQFVINFVRRKDTGAPGYLFTYTGDPENPGTLLEADPEFSITDQPTDVEVLVYDRKKRTIERTIIADETKAEDVKLEGGRIAPGRMVAKTSIEVGARVRFSAFGQVHEVFADRPFRSQKEAKNFVENWLRERERDFLTMTGRVIGIPELRSRQIHEIRGLGKRLDGLYRFTNVKHSMNPGSNYDCSFAAHKILSQEIARRAPATKTQTSSKGTVAAG